MKKIIIIGAGVSGLSSAIKIKNNNNEVLVLEKNSIPGKKILVTGNGRCNFLNDEFNPNHFHSVIKNDISKIINEENKNRVLNFIKSLGIEYKNKNGYYYPFTNKAITIRDSLYEEATKLGVEFKFDYEVKTIKKNNRFIINDEYESDILIVSTGSKSYPKTGSTGEMYSILNNIGHSVSKLYPGLVQVKTNGNFLKELDGVRTDAYVSIYDNDKLIKEELGELQFASYGVSGICVFNISRYVHLSNKPIIKINFMPYTDDYKNYILNLNDSTIYNTLKKIVNDKIASVILKLTGINKDKLKSKLNNEELDKIIDYMTNFRLEATGTKDYDSGQITVGGIDLNEININTFESKIVNNLFILGELTDVDGDCGGFNISYAILSSLICSDRVRDLCLE